MFVHNFDGFYDKNKLDQVAFNCTLFEQNAKIMLYKYSIKKNWIAQITIQTKHVRYTVNISSHLSFKLAFYL